MCLNCEISTCSLNVIIFGGLLLLFSCFGLNDKSNSKVIGDLNIKNFSIILFCISIILLVYGFSNVCKRKNNYRVL